MIAFDTFSTWMRLCLSSLAIRFGIRVVVIVVLSKPFMHCCVCLCVQVLDLPWLSAHLCDVIYHASPIGSSARRRLTEPLPIPEAMGIRTKLLFEYGLSIVDHRDLWHLSPSYLT